MILGYFSCSKTVSSSCSRKGTFNTRIISYKYIDEDVEEVGAG